ncbi:MAG TPA: crosslink repair DNA glycosylase YcaQ family protein [Candidatus Bathyarchaeia archaeon]|nr:crosslink repair DNA glycosylase YcaQ family protein [Candidatus Bathyarchaeia archaeon]
MEEKVDASLESVRRLFVRKQRLAGRLPGKPSKDDLLSVVRNLCYVQWDPVDAVAPSHIISFWSRIGSFRREDLDALLWNDRKLFMHWNPAMLVPTEFYPLFYSLTRRYPDSVSDSWGTWKNSARKFLATHRELQKRVLAELRKRGPLSANEFQDHVPRRSSDGWTSGSDVSQMLFHLLMLGQVMVVGHRGNQNMWDLADEFLPGWVEKKEISQEEFEHEAAQKALRSLGTATPREIFLYFPRARYLQLNKTIAGLEKESKVHRVHVKELGQRDERYVHVDDVALLESIEQDLEPRMTLLSPFDNLLNDHGRLSRLFGFDYVHENFLPKNKRKYGTFVHPILYGGNLIGRADLLRDKESQRLRVIGLFAEPGAPKSQEVASRLRDTFEDFAEFVGAREVVYPVRVPSGWR